MIRLLLGGLCVSQTNYQNAANGYEMNKDFNYNYKYDKKNLRIDDCNTTWLILIILAFLKNIFE